MTLVERYLRAVRDHLPRDQQDDIVNELSDSIHSRIEDEEATLNRPLLEAEAVAILRGFGHPMAVAARYRGDERTLTFGRRLIGPELFATYLKVLTVNLGVTLIIAATAFVAGGSLWSGITGITGIFVLFAIQFTAVTAIFIAVDRRWVRDPEGWDPRTVNSMGPDVDVSSLDGLAVQLIGKAHTRTVAIASSVLEIGLLGVALTAWLAIGLPERIGFMAPGAGWRNLFVPATVLIAAAVLVPVATLVRPTWTRFRVAAHALIDISTIVLGAVSLALGSWVVLVDPASAPPDALKLVDLVNGFVRVSIAGTIALTAVNAALEVRRFVRMGRAPAAWSPRA